MQGNSLAERQPPPVHNVLHCLLSALSDGTLQAWHTAVAHHEGAFKRISQTIASRLQRVKHRASDHYIYTHSVLRTSAWVRLRQEREVMADTVVIHLRCP